MLKQHITRDKYDWYAYPYYYYLSLSRPLFNFLQSVSLTNKHDKGSVGRCVVQGRRRGVASGGCAPPGMDGASKDEWTECQKNVHLRFMPILRWRNQKQKAS